MIDLGSIGIGYGRALRAHTPAAIYGLTLWLDASDASSIVSSSGAVSQWSDKSGNGYHATQSGAANKPITGTRTINSLNALDFDGTNDRLELASGLYSLPNGDNTCFVVFASDDIASAEQRLFGATDGGTSRWYISRIQSGGNVRAANRTSNTTSEITGLATSITQHIAILRRESSVVNVIYGGTIGANGVGASFTATNGQIGATTNANFFNGMIAEVIMYNRAIALPEINAVGSALALKWGAPWANV